MAELFANGRIVDLILLLMAGQWLAFLGLHKRFDWGLRPVDYLCNLLPGACLLLALRAALVDAHWPLIAVWLLASLVGHGLELGRRLRKPGTKRFDG